MIKNLLFCIVLMNIIQTWKSNEIPGHYKPFIESVFKYTKNWNYMFFNDNEIERFIDEKMPEYRTTFDNLTYKIQKIDFFRYLAVYYYGGVYLDLDILLHTDLDGIIENPEMCKFPVEIDTIKDTVITRHDFHSLIGNYAFYAPAKHPFLKQIIDNICNSRMSEEDILLAQSTNGDSTKEVYVYCTTGPLMVTQSYIDYENKSDIELLRPSPYRVNFFGDYGKHCSYGSWK